MDDADRARRAEAEERTLVELANTGDRDALTKLLIMYQPRLYAVCLRMAPDEHIAQELTQDALLTIVEKLHTFDGRSKLSTWLIRIAMNRCLTHRRRQTLRPKPVDPQAVERASQSGSGVLSGVGSPASTSSPTTGPNAGTGTEPSGAPGVSPEEQRRVLDALHTLEPDAHAILVLRDIQGLSYDHIAEALDLAAGTVKSRLFRARAALRKALDPPPSPPAPPSTAP